MFYEKYVDLCAGINKTPTGVALDIGLSNEGSVNISGNSLNGTYNQIGAQPQMCIKAQDLTSQEEALLSQFRKLSEVDKAKALIYISELTEGDK